METHGGDPRSPEDQDPWDVVAVEFKDLGQRLRESYGRVVGDEGPSGSDIRDALATLASVWSQVAESVGEALRDTEVRRRLRQTASAFATALGSTIAALGDELDAIEEE
ncbi:MAG: hypothetical protein L0Z63_06785 [Actinobacteria bacterium]|nr:hypothetical protein [Actinomycetota bacterium]